MSKSGNNLVFRSPTAGRKRQIVIASVVAIVLILFAVVSSLSGKWSFLHPFTVRSGVSVMEATLLSPDRLVLVVGSCNGDPEVTLLREMDTEVQVKVITSSWPFRGGGDDCLDGIEVQLQEPFGDRILVDKHAGQAVDVTGGVSIRGEVGLHDAVLLSPDRFALNIGTCNGNPELSVLRETDDDVQVSVISSSNPYPVSSDECEDSIEIQLQAPLGDRKVVDIHDGEQVRFWGAASVFEVVVTPSGKVALQVAACQANPQVTELRETDIDVQVRVIALSEFYGTEKGCSDGLVIELQRPLGDRVVIDLHTGQTVSIRRIGSSSDQGEVGDLPDVAPPKFDDPPNEAELQDLQRFAEQKGITFQEAIDGYAWRDNFSLLASIIRGDFPGAFAGAQIEDDGHAWVAFVGPAPKGALDIIDRFTSSQSGVTVEVRAGIEFTEEEIQKAIPAAHYAVYESPEVREATTDFDYATGQITTVVILEDAASESALTDLRAAAMKAIADATRPDFLDSITYSVVASNRETLGGLD